MHAFVDLEEYEKSVYRLFGRFPFLLLVIAFIGAMIVGAVMMQNSGGFEEESAFLELFSNGFFRGVLVTVAIYYLGRIYGVNSVKNAQNLVGRDGEGVFIPCVSHKTPWDFSGGSIIIKPGRMYFEPSRPFGGDLTFDYAQYSNFKFELSNARESIGLFIVTGEKYMLAVTDSTGSRVGTFIIPEPEKHLPELQALLA